MVERRLGEVATMSAGDVSQNSTLRTLLAFARQTDIWTQSEVDRWLDLLNARREILCNEFAHPASSQLQSLDEQANSLLETLDNALERIDSQQASLSKVDDEMMQRAEHSLA
jgi:flagellar hook-associated protein FlgK